MRPSLLCALMCMLALTTVLPAAGCGSAPGAGASKASSSSKDVDRFLADYNAAYQRLWTDAEGSKFVANSDITPANTAREVAAAQALADYVGSREVIETLRTLRRMPGLDDLRRRQLDVAWQQAAQYPGTAPETVSRLLAAEAGATAAMYGHEFRLALPGEAERVVTPSEIQDLLAESRDPAVRRAVWECSKTVGPPLRDRLLELQTLRNAVAREMGYSSYFALKCDDYGLSSAEMMTLMDDVVAGVMPIYTQLHTWARYQLAARYGVDDVPAQLPAHWVANRWGQEWPGLVEGVDLDALLSGRTPQWVIEQAERFYVSLGMPALPASFWTNSDLFELPAGATRKKNTHASAWHVDLDQDVRSLMSVRSDYDWFTTTHHELGHVYYYLAYSRPEVPPILRRGANRAFHEAVGTLIELACGQVPYLEQVGLLAAGQTPEQSSWLLSQALTGPVVFLPFAAGTMAHWEHDFYETDLPADQLNARWWQHAARFQGLAPPAPRDETFCDPATKTHIVDDAGEYYDYALSAVILHQLHRHICAEILHQDVRAANYYGNREVGAYLHGLLAAGATRDWRELLREATGEELSSAAMLAYFAPLQAWLTTENAGRAVGW